MIALNEPFSGNLQGLRNADLNCHRQARRAGLMGNFRAFLSTRFAPINFPFIYTYTIDLFINQNLQNSKLGFSYQAG